MSSDDWRFYVTMIEKSHAFGGDASTSFSQSLTSATELLMEHQESVVKGKSQWEQVFTAHINAAM